MNFNLQLKKPAEATIISSSEYQALKSQFSLLFNESVQLKTLVDESRALLQQTRNAQLRQIEQMEVRMFLVVIKPFQYIFSSVYKSTLPHVYI